MDLIIELTKLGTVGIFAAIMYKQWQDERASHTLTRAALIQAMMDRLSDSKENSASLIATQNGVASSLDRLSEKITTGRVR